MRERLAREIDIRESFGRKAQRDGETLQTVKLEKETAVKRVAALEAEIKKCREREMPALREEVGQGVAARQELRVENGSLKAEVGTLRQKLQVAEAGANTLRAQLIAAEQQRLPPSAHPFAILARYAAVNTTPSATLTACSSGSHRTNVRTPDESSSFLNGPPATPALRNPLSTAGTTVSVI